MSVYPSSYARMPILSQQNTCNSFFMRILSLYRRVFFFLLLFSMLGSYYNFMLVCFFFYFRCLFHLRFMRSIFFVILPEMFIFFSLVVFFMKRRSYLVFVIVFHEIFPISQTTAHTYIYTIICTYIPIRNRVIENEDV